LQVTGEFKDKKIVITGGSNGLGLSIASKFINEGGIVCNIDKQSSEQHLTNNFECDVNDYDRLYKISKEIINKLEWVDILINNAGIVKVAPFSEQNTKDWEELIQTNIIGVFNVTRIFGEIMIARKSGCIINIASTDGLVGKIGHQSELGVINVVAYAATKGAIITFTKALAVEWGKYNIRVNTICPSLMLTSMTKCLFEDEKKVIEYTDLSPINKIVTVDDVAESVLFLSNTQKASAITGCVLVIDAGYLSYGELNQP
jgi:gluconate 5-dehydrogenase